MIFIRYESWKQYVRQYPINTLIMLLCIVMFAVELIGGGFTYGNLLRLGAINNIPGYDEGMWRYAAALFLHGSWSHIIFNLFAIFVFAPPLERMFGHVRYAVFYLVTGILGNAFSVAMVTDANWIGIGASTSIYGIYGAYLYLCLFERHKLDSGSRTTVYGILATGLIYSFIVPNVGYWAHIGGLIAGFALYKVLGPRWDRQT